MILKMDQEKSHKKLKISGKNRSKKRKMNRGLYLLSAAMIQK